MKLTKSIFALAMLATAGMSAQASAADSKYPAYPFKTVTLITSSGPGGGGDVFLRNLVKVLGPRWDINFVVENVPGSGGANAMRRIATAPADGSILYGVSTQHVIVSIMSDPPYKYTDMQPVANLLFDAPVLFVRSESPYKNIGDFVSDAKKNPGHVRLGIGTAASSDRLTAEQIKSQEGIDIVVATHDSGGQNLIDVLSGAVDIGIGDSQEIAPQIEAGKMRIVASLTKERLPNFPDIQTAQEQGLDVVMLGWRGFVAKKGTPPEIIDAWEKAAQLVLNDPEYRDYVLKAGEVPTYLSSKQFDEVTNQYAKDIEAFFSKVGIVKK